MNLHAATENHCAYFVASNSQSSSDRAYMCDHSSMQRNGNFRQAIRVSSTRNGRIDNERPESGRERKATDYSRFVVDVAKFVLGIST